MKTNKMEKQEHISSVSLIIALLVFTIFWSLVFNMIFDTGLGCKIKDVFNGEDKYCYHIPSFSNVSSTPEYIGWEMRSHKQDVIDAKNREEERIRILEQERNREECFNLGEDYYFSYDIIKDYNLSCKKIEYINDHLIDKKINGGYIDGSYRGFFSRGSVQGSFDIVMQSLATGKLVKEVNYHLDCNEQKSNELIEYYEESDFVMYYVERCING